MSYMTTGPDEPESYRRNFGEPLKFELVEKTGNILIVGRNYQNKVLHKNNNNRSHNISLLINIIESIIYKICIHFFFE